MGENRATAFWNGAEFSLGEMSMNFSCRRQVWLSRPPQALVSKPETLGRIGPNGQLADARASPLSVTAVAPAPRIDARTGSPLHHKRYFWCWKLATFWQAFSIKSACLGGGGRWQAISAQHGNAVCECVCIYLGCLE